MFVYICATRIYCNWLLISLVAAEPRHYFLFLSKYCVVHLFKIIFVTSLNIDLILREVYNLIWHAKWGIQLL